MGGKKKLLGLVLAWVLILTIMPVIPARVSAAKGIQTGVS